MAASCRSLISTSCSTQPLSMDEGIVDSLCLLRRAIKSTSEGEVHMKAAIAKSCIDFGFLMSTPQMYLYLSTIQTYDLLFRAQYCLIHF